MSEPTKIEPYYQGQAKEVVNFLFDKGYFSETLSRDGMNDVEGLLALYLQLGAQSATRRAEMSKKFKAKPREGGEDPARHEKEIGWIARAKEAEEEIAVLVSRERKTNAVWKWGQEVCALLKKALAPPLVLCGRENFEEVSRLLTDAIKLGITQGAIPEGFRSGPIPGTLSPNRRCESMHGFDRCQLPQGHPGSHQHRDGRYNQEWR